MHRPADHRTPPAETRVIATTRDGRDVTRGFVDALPYVHPQDTVLRTRAGTMASGAHNLGRYHGLYREVLRDDQVYATLEQRRLAVVSAETRVLPGGTMRRDRQAAEMVEEALTHVRWDTVTEKMLYARFYGFAVAEAVWARDGGHVALDRLAVRNLSRFVFAADEDGEGFSPLLVTTHRPQGEPLPERKFWVLSTGADHDDEPYGLGLAHWLYWPVFFKRNQMRFWLTAQERFGEPTTVGKYPRHVAGTVEVDNLKAALRDVSRDGKIVVPDDVVIELLEASGTGSGGNVSFGDFHDAMNAAISKVVLGQTMTTDDGSSQSQATVHMEVRRDLIAADAKLVCDGFNRTVARWLTEWNYPGAATPLVERATEPPDDLDARSRRDERVVRFTGRKPDPEYVEETYGIPLADESPPMPDPQPQPPTTDLAEDGDGDPVPALAKRLRREAGPALDAWSAAVRARAAESGSLEDLRDWIEDRTVPAVDTGPAVDAMAAAFAAAHLAGRVDIDDGPAEFAEGDSADRAVMPFDEQIAFFRSKLNLRTSAWTDIWQEHHDVAFVVAGAARDELLADLRGAVDKAIADGETLAGFRSRFDEIVAKHGWSYNGGRDWRSRVIYETNLRTSYAAGRWRQLREVKERRPYWRYRHSPASVEARPEHVSWDGLILSADDPWWNTNYPPNGWGCRCFVEALSRRDLERLDREGPDEAPPLDVTDVEVGSGASRRTERAPAGVDPGFAYAPGASLGDAQRRAVERLEDRFRALEDSVRATLETRLLQRSVYAGLDSDAFRRFVREARTGDGEEWAVALFTGGRLAELGLDTKGRALRLSSDTADMESHRRRWSAFSAGDWARVQTIIDEGEWIAEDGNHRLLWMDDQGRPWMAVVKSTRNDELYLVSYRRAGEREVRNWRARR